MKRTDFPRQIRIENTILCNANCTICPREKLCRPAGTMDLEFFKDLIRQAVEGQAKEVHLQGYGEPFLDKTIFEKIEYAKKSGVPYTFMVTNASLLDEGMALKLLDSGLDKLKISFYGIDEKEYEDIHKKLSYALVKGNVKNLLDMKKTLKKKKPVISLKYIGPPWRFPVFLLQWWPGAVVSYSHLHNYVDGRRFNRPKTEKKNRKCRIVNDSVMQILWDGRVVPCCYDFNGKIILGDLRNESISQVWKGEKYEAFRSLHESKEFEKLPFCHECDKLR